MIPVNVKQTVAVFLAILSPCVAVAEVVRDTLCMTDTGQIDGIGPAYCGGEAVLGERFDVQAAADFVMDHEVLITSVTGDYFTFLGLPPDAVNVFFYPLEDQCLADNNVFWQAVVDPGDLHLEDIPNDFGFVGLRIAADLPEPCLLPPGHWFVCIQPVSPDFGQQIAALMPDCVEQLCDANARDGGDRNTLCEGRGAYNYQDWRCCELFERSTLAFRVVGLAMGGCNENEKIKARCKGHGDTRRVIVKVRRATAGETLTAELDAPTGITQPIEIDDRGRGKARFPDVPPGTHTATVCGKTVDVTCGE